MRKAVVFVLCLSSLFAFACQTQPTPPPTVTQIDETGLKDLLKPKSKPVLINFWATWCGPCREEFPDLVEIGKDHKEKIDLITVTLDEPSEINTTVPEFLSQMGSDSPAFLLKTQDQDAAINLVSKDWTGALPFTILINAQGETVYSRQGKFNPSALVAEIGKL
ncbi:MAG TPA: TlpA disulfide reductase family protein [Pyrinomonadaceae bacterium]